MFPQIVAPGTVTVTTIITSEINGQLPIANNQLSTTLYDAPLTEADLDYLNREAEEAPVVESGQEELPIANVQLPIANDEGSADSLTIDHSQLTIDNSLPLSPLHRPPHRHRR